MVQPATTTDITNDIMSRRPFFANRKFCGDESLGWIQVIFAGFIDDPEIAGALRFRVGQCHLSFSGAPGIPRSRRYRDRQIDVLLRLPFCASF
jgi:hypothetical protein